MDKLENIYNVHWVNESHDIVYAKYPIDWTWDDFYMIREQVHALVDSENTARVDFIADQSASILPKGSPFGHARSVIQNKHPRVKLIVIVASNALLRSMANIAFKLSAEARSSFRLVSSIEDALQLIETDRSAE
jgi:hypothetical protein